MPKSFGEFERRIHYIAKNYVKRSLAAVEASMTRVLKDVALADNLTPEERGSLAASLFTLWPEVQQRPSLTTIASQVTAIRAQHLRLQEAHRQLIGAAQPPATAPPPPAPDPSYAAANGRIKRGYTHSIYLRHEVYDWYMQQCPVGQRGRAELVRGISAVFERMTTPRMTTAHTAPPATDATDASEPLHPRSLNDLALLNRLEDGKLFDRLSAAVEAMHEAAGVIEMVTLNRPIGEGVRAQLHEDLTSAASLLEELLEHRPAFEPELPFDPLHDDE